ncbi:MAG: molybdenum ABC transporter substrate-binding protein, partial [Burkholderiales bacterium PBB5]
MPDAPHADRPLQGISSMATRLVLAELAAAHQQQGGALVDWLSIGGVDAARRVAAGAPFDLVALAADAIDKLVRRAVLAAPTLGYSTGPSGVALAALFQRWGIAEQIAPRIQQPPPGVPVGQWIAEGRIALGFQQRSELIHVPGIQIVGPLPPAI